MKNAPMYGMGVLFPTLALGISCIGFLVAYIFFIVHEGYGNQIQEIITKGIDEAFTYGTVGMLYRGPVGRLTLIILVISLVLGVVLHVFLASLSGSDVSRNVSSRDDLISKDQEVNKNAFQPKVKNFSRDVRFYRGEGGYGIAINLMESK